jgi:hypothetical protein
VSREIKFRAWFHGAGEPFTPHMEYSATWPVKFWQAVEDFPLASEVMQFTGMKDENGVEIYEDDIYEWEEPVADYHTITTRALIAMDVESLWLLASYLGGSVIGNIHENPELLGGDHE